MKIYLAGPRDMQTYIREKANELAKSNHIITSRWVYDFPESSGQHSAWGDPTSHAIKDLADLANSQTLIQFTKPTETPETGYITTGGHHVELGFALATRTNIIIVGHVHNVFQTLEHIEIHRQWSIAILETLSSWEKSEPVCAECGGTKQDWPDHYVNPGWPCYWISPNLCSCCYLDTLDQTTQWEMRTCLQCGAPVGPCRCRGDHKWDCTNCPATGPGIQLRELYAWRPKPTEI